MTRPSCPDANRYSYTPPGSPGRDKTLGPHKRHKEPRASDLQALKPRYALKYRLSSSLAGRKAPRDGMIFHAMLLAEDRSLSTGEKPQPAPSLTSRSSEEEARHSSDPLE
ncbi:hypothetical protein LINPERHAP1_LOCUS21478, partial [Linum perenne]